MILAFVGILFLVKLCLEKKFDGQLKTIFFPPFTSLPRMPHISHKFTLTKCQYLTPRLCLLYPTQKHPQSLISVLDVPADGPMRHRGRIDWITRTGP